MNYLAGPLTRAQIPALNRLGRGGGGQEETAGPKIATAAPVSKETPTRPRGEAVIAAAAAAVSRPTPPASPSAPGTTTRPAVPAGISECFLPNSLTFTQALQRACEAQGKPYPQEARSAGLLYRPVILAQANVRFLNRKYNLDTELLLCSLVPDPDRRGAVRWEDYPARSVPASSLDERPAPEARFAALDPPLNDAKILSALQRDFEDWAYREAKAIVRANVEAAGIRRTGRLSG